MSPQARRKRARGDWSRLRDPQLLVSWMNEKDMSQARLGRYAECSRQFINQLIKGERGTRTPQVAERIEEGLSVVPGTLFEHFKSPSERQKACSVGRPAVASKVGAA